MSGQRRLVACLVCGLLCVSGRALAYAAAPEPGLQEPARPETPPPAEPETPPPAEPETPKASEPEAPKAEPEEPKAAEPETPKASEPEAPKANEPEEPKAPEPEASTEPEKSRLPGFLGEIEASGFVDVYFGYNFNHPFDRRNQLRFFDIQDRQFAFNLAQLSLLKEPSASSRVGFRVDLGIGPGADALSAFEPGKMEIYKHLLQAYGSYLVPLGQGLQIDVGKFTTWVGSEYDQPTLNSNYSRGMLYAFGTPAYHSGLQGTYHFNPKVTLLGAVLNGWDNIEDNNGGLSYGFGLTVTPVPKLEIIQSYIGGPEQTNEVEHKRNFFGTVVTYKIHPRWTAIGEYLYAFDTLTSGEKLHWTGFAAYLRFAATPRLALAPRFEVYNDHGGFTTKTSQTLTGLTLTAEYTVGAGFVARFEFRRDTSDHVVFLSDVPGFPKQHQAGFLLGLVWSFDTKMAKGAEASSPPAAPSEPAAAPGPMRPAKGRAPRLRP